MFQLVDESMPISTFDTPEQDMLCQERRRHIIRLTEENGRALVREVAERFGRSIVTIRRDFDVLASKKLIYRCYGGALPIHTTQQFAPPFPELVKTHLAKNRDIAAAAANLIREDDCIILNAGTINQAIAHELRRFGFLTVITNSLSIATELRDTSVDVHLIGGKVMKNSDSVVGPIAEENLQELRAQLLLLQAENLDLEIGATAPKIFEARVIQGMLKIFRHCVVVCYSNSISRRSLSKIISMPSIRHVITNRDLADEIATAVRCMSIELTLV